MKSIAWGKRGLSMLVLSGLLLCQTAGSVALAQEKSKEPVLKVDRQDVTQLPRNFRTSNDAFKSLPKDGTMPSRVGMNELHESGSSIFSELEFQEVMKKLPGKVIVVDLRQESHGYLNGTAVSWFGENNWGNDGKSLAEVKVIERKLLDEALQQSPVSIHKYNDANDTLGEAFSLEVSSVRTEEEMVKAHGAGYFRLALSDHFRPDDDKVDEFIAFYKALPKDAWLHFHCYAGQGRTTTFMAMYDILRNAKKVSFDDIMERQALIGLVDLRDVPPSKKNWKRKAYTERAQFIKHFYDYVKQSPDTLPQSWSDWAKKHDYNTL